MNYSKVIGFNDNKMEITKKQLAKKCGNYCSNVDYEVLCIQILASIEPSLSDTLQKQSWYSYDTNMNKIMYNDMSLFALNRIIIVV